MLKFKSAPKAVLSLLVVLSFIAASLKPTPAQAFEKDVHFYFTYLMLRAAGIDEQVALKLATADQWIDETLTTTAMETAKQRWINHFPGEMKVVKNTAHGGLGVMAQIKGNWTAIATPDSPIAHMYGQIGHEDGDLIAVGMDLHVGQDNTGVHAGFTNSVGHALNGHDTDRVWLHQEKFLNMVHMIMRRMIAIRTSLEKTAPWAVDLEASRKILGSDLKESDFYNADFLADRLLARPEIKEWQAHDFTRDPEYVEYGVKKIMEIAKSKGWVRDDVTVESLLPSGFKYDGTKDIHEVIELIMLDGEMMIAADGKTPIFNNDIMIQQLGVASQTYKQFYDMQYAINFKRIQREEGLSDLAAATKAKAQSDKYVVWRIADRLVEGHAPQKLNEWRQAAFEEEGHIRELEVALRCSTMQKIIASVLGEKVTFEAKTTMALIKSYLKKHPKGEPLVGTENYVEGAQVGTFGLQTRMHFVDVAARVLLTSIPKLQQKANAKATKHLELAALVEGLEKGLYQPLIKSGSRLEKELLNGRDKEELARLRKLTIAEALSDGTIDPKDIFDLIQVPSYEEVQAREDMILNGVLPVNAYRTEDGRTKNSRVLQCREQFTRSN